MEIFLTLIVSLLIYLIPSFIALNRGHSNTAAIVVLNIIGGLFFGVGWILALIWSFTDNVKKSSPASEYKPCRNCGEYVSNTARICKYCNEEI